MRARYLALAVTLAAALLPFRPSAAAEPFDAEQKKAIEILLHDYLLAHPEILEEAIRALQAKRTAEAAAQREKKLAALHKEVEDDPATPVAGDLNGDVTLIQFFDYQCGYCKSVLPALQQLMQEDRRIRFVMKEVPLLGPASVHAARAGLAAWKIAPEKYLGFHMALMGLKTAITDDSVMELARRNGLDPKRLRDAMADPTIDAAIQRNHALAESLEITGTPAFIVGKTFVPGAVDLAALRKLIAEARGR